MYVFGFRCSGGLKRHMILSCAWKAVTNIHHKTQSITFSREIPSMQKSEHSFVSLSKSTYLPFQYSTLYYCDLNPASSSVRSRTSTSPTHKQHSSSSNREPREVGKAPEVVPCASAWPRRSHLSNPAYSLGEATSRHVTLSSR